VIRNSEMISSCGCKLVVKSVTLIENRGDTLGLSVLAYLIF